MFINLKRVLNYLAELHGRMKLVNMFLLLKNKLELKSGCSPCASHVTLKLNKRKFFITSPC
jgi:hypothetical protein